MHDSLTPAQRRRQSVVDRIEAAVVFAGFATPLYFTPFTDDMPPVLWMLLLCSWLPGFLLAKLVFNRYAYYPLRRWVEAA